MEFPGTHRCPNTLSPANILWALSSSVNGSYLSMDTIALRNWYKSAVQRKFPNRSSYPPTNWTRNGFPPADDCTRACTSLYTCPLPGGLQCEERPCPPETHRSQQPGNRWAGRVGHLPVPRGAVERPGVSGARWFRAFGAAAAAVECQFRSAGVRRFSADTAFPAVRSQQWSTLVYTHSPGSGAAASVSTGHVPRKAVHLAADSHPTRVSQGLRQGCRYKATRGANTHCATDFALFG